MSDNKPKATITETEDSSPEWPRFLVTAPPGYRFGVNLYSVVINGPRTDAERFAELQRCVPDSNTDAEVTLTRHSFVDLNDPALAGELSPLAALRTEYQLFEIDKCPRCTECVGQEHHWLESDEVYSEDDPEYMCKHCIAVCDGVDDADGLMVPSGIARPSKRNGPKIATKVRDIAAPAGAHAALYRCDPPLCGCKLVVASSAISDSGPETLLVEATQDGEPLWSEELDGGYVGGMDHVEAFANVGYEIVNDN